MDVALYKTRITHMKQNKKYLLSLNYSALISPLIPRVQALDSIGSLFNFTGTYYNIESNLDALCKASEHISKLNDVWENVGMDIFKATDQFAKLNNMDLTPFEYNLPKLPNNSWEYLLNPKKY